MKVSSLLWGLLLGAAADVMAQGAEEEEEIPVDFSQEVTEFDGKKVPPILELTPDTFDKEIKASKHMVVKLYRCADPRLNMIWPDRHADKDQSVLPSLPGLCARLPNTVRILPHRGDARRVQDIYRVL